MTESGTVRRVACSRQMGSVLLPPAGGLKTPGRISWPER